MEAPLADWSLGGWAAGLRVPALAGGIALGAAAGLAPSSAAEGATALGLA